MPAKAGFFQHVVDIWLRLTSANPQHFSTSMQDQERLRRSRLLGSLLTLILVSVVVSIPNTVALPVIGWILVMIVLMGVGAALINRQGYVTLAGLVCIFIVDIAVTAVLVVQPHGITSSNYSDFDIFLIAVLISGLVLKRQFIPLVTGIQIIMVVAIYVLLPHDPLFLQEVQVHQNGLIYAELSNAFLLQICCGVIAWLGAWSVDKALMRASQAEELGQAQVHIQQQARAMAEQKKRMDQGILLLKEAQSRVANGDYSARAILHDNELFPLAMSFNLMMERLGRLGRIEQDHQSLEQTMQRSLKPLSQDSFYAFHPPIDQAITVVERYARVMRLLDQSRSQCVELQLVLRHQHEQLTHLNKLLRQNYSLAQTLLTNDRHTDSRLLRVPYQQDNQLLQESHIMLAAQQAQFIQALEAAGGICMQARQANMVCGQKVYSLAHLFRLEKRSSRV